MQVWSHTDFTAKVTVGLVQSSLTSLTLHNAQMGLSRPKPKLPGHQCSKHRCRRLCLRIPEFTAQWALTIEAFWWMYNHNAPRDVMMKTVNPYGMMNNDPTWANGQTGHSVSGGQYVEDLGGFVAVQTSHLTNDSNFTTPTVPCFRRILPASRHRQPTSASSLMVAIQHQHQHRLDDRTVAICRCGHKHQPLGRRPRRPAFQRFPVDFNTTHRKQSILDTKW